MGLLLQGLDVSEVEVELDEGECCLICGRFDQGRVLLLLSGSDGSDLLLSSNHFSDKLPSYLLVKQQVLGEVMIAS